MPQTTTSYAGTALEELAQRHPLPGARGQNKHGDRHHAGSGRAWFVAKSSEEAAQ